MKKNIFLFMFLLCTGYAFAQGGEGYQQMTSEDRARTFVKKLHDRIPFRDGQRDSLIATYKTFFEEMEMYRSDGNMEVVKILTQKRDNNVKQILADDDKYAVYVKYLDELRAEREKRRQESGGGTPGGGPPGGGYGGRHRGQ